MGQKRNLKYYFRRISTAISQWAGKAQAFMLALLVVAVWALCGPVFNFSNTWQLVINSTTTIVTFLMVFLIQNTQNRDGKAMQLKLDEIIRSSHARASFIDLEAMSDDELNELDNQFRIIHEAQMATPTIRRLHEHIQAAKLKRDATGRSVATQMEHAAEKIIHKLNPFDDDDPAVIPAGTVVKPAAAQASEQVQHYESYRPPHTQHRKQAHHANAIHRPRH